MSTSTFHLFPYLPAEIRLMIWEAALCVPTVWAAVGVEPGPGKYYSNRAQPPFTMHFLGPAPIDIGLASKEAWDVMRRCCVAPVRTPGEVALKSRRTWVNLQDTVVHWGNIDDMSIKHFDAGDLSRVVHVAVHSFNFFGRDAPLEMTMKRLASECPALRTIIMEGRAYRSVSHTGTWASFRILRPSDITGYLTDIIASTEPYLACPGLTKRCLKFFGDAPPRFYIIM
ncbi:hypothetical protein QBC39DRAFT_363956 [Podospora conica]|nr:hypothetical protein QBC39DRAFT_363956 [Schizothecium conicum]